MDVVKSIWLKNNVINIELTDDKRRRINKVFAHYDFDDKDSMSTTDVYDALKKLGEQVTIKQVDNLTKAYDKYGTGHINLDLFTKIVVEIWQKESRISAESELEKALSNLSRTEINKLKKSFAYYDKNDSNSILKSALREALNDLGEDVSGRQARKLLEKYAANGTKELSFSEFAIIVKSLWNIDNDDSDKIYIDTKDNLLNRKEIAHYRKLFDKYDKDMSDTIGPRELKKLLKDTGHGFSKAEIDNLLDNMDFDDSGNVDFNEFLNVISPILFGNLASSMEHPSEINFSNLSIV